jgi:deoxyribonuclease-4
VKIGFHLSIAGGFDEVLKEAKRLRCEVIQIFLKNPRSWKEKEWHREDVEAFKVLKGIMPVFAHLSYLPNLAKIDLDEKHMMAFLHEADLCQQLGVQSMVVHCGSREDRKKGIQMVADAASEVLKSFPISILLENAAGQGSSIGGSLEELAEIHERVADSERTSLCLDTAHFFQYGYDIRLVETWEKVASEVERLFGKGKIALFHLNDSRSFMGSRVDRHWHIGKGEIGISGFRGLLQEKSFARLPGVMETPKTGNMDRVNMKTMRSLLSSLVSRSLS